MKNLISLVLFLSLPLFSSAQIYIDGQPFDEVVKGRFFDVCVYQIPLSMKFRAVVNYGQETKVQIGMPSENLISNENGSYIKFNSYVQLINLMEENGFEYIDKSGRGEGYSCYLFRRKE